MEQRSEEQQSAEQWALVTGASAGIGEEFCRQLAQQGWPLVMVARRGERLRELADQLKEQFNVDCHCITQDLAETDATENLAGLLETEGIQIGLLVNNAGYGVPGNFAQSDWQVHSASLQVMLNSVCELSWRFLPQMHARKRGYIINVASLAGLTPGGPGHTLYGATKSFLIKFSESLSSENRDTGVAVIALCPGFTYSEFHDVTKSRELVSQMPDYMWMSAEDVVRFGLKSVLAEKPLVTAIPGRVNRFIATLVRLLPRKVAYGLTRRQSSRWRNHEDALK